MFKEYYEKMLKQLSIDFNCTPEDLLAKENKITVSADNAGRRMYDPNKTFLDMVTLGGNALVTADECLHEFLRGFIKDAEGHRLFEVGKLSILDQEVRKYGYKMAGSHHMFLPCRKVEVEERYPVKWFFDEEINGFYGDSRFPNSICYPEPSPTIRDRMVVAAYDGDTIMGMSGCSEDAPNWMQVGVDVLPEYRSKGLGTYLVTLMKNKIIEQGAVPFYGTASSNIHSQKIALSAGFCPAWVEVESYKIEKEKK